MTSRIASLGAAILTLSLFPFAAGAAPSETARALIVVTNHGELGATGERTGYYLSEVSHPHHALTEAGHAVDFASPAGGFAPMDPKSFDMDDPVNRAFWLTHGIDLQDTIPLSNVDPSDYRAIIFAGGHGTMWDFAGNEDIGRVTSSIYEGGGIVAAVCHGPAALVNVRLSEGNYLVEGRKVAAFTNSEEEAVGLTEVMPFLLETTLKARGADHVAAPDFESNVVVDGRLVTGQNPASALGVGEEVARLLETAGVALRVHDIPFAKMNGDTATLGAFAPDVVLVVNTASQCGFTPQYKGLEDLYQSYRGKGFTVIAFPSNDYGGQEPGSDQQILQFCEENYGVTFPVMSKAPTRGDDRIALYQALTGEESPFPGEVRWNFEKFLIGRDGTIRARFGSRVAPNDPELIRAVETALSEEAS